MTITPNAIENIIARLDGVTQHPMSDSLTRVMITLMTSEMKSDIPESTKPLPVKIIESRLKLFTFTMEFKVVLFLATLAKSPGEIVIYLWYLQYWCKKHKVQHITLHIIAEQIFPMGFFSEEDLAAIWVAQKIDSNPDNLFDHRAAGESILKLP